MGCKMVFKNAVALYGIAQVSNYHSDVACPQAEPTRGG